MKFINKYLLESKIDKLKNDLNKLFFNADPDIKEILKYEKIVTRNRILSFKDVLCYKFNYTYKYSTQLSAINDYKFENKIPLEYCKKNHTEILNLHNKNFSKLAHNIVAVDGTYNNTNISNNKQLKTSLNMGYYDVTNGIPIELTFKGKDYKNKEIESLIDKIKENNIDLTSIIFVLDRAYCSYELMNFLESKNIKFVTRIKNNFKCIKEQNITVYNPNFRLVSYNFSTSSIKELLNKKEDKLEIYEVIVNVNCNVITNLDLNLYNDDQIRDIYNSRWKVEEFFKLIKSNFNFYNLREHNN